MIEINRPLTSTRINGVCVSFWLPPHGSAQPCWVDAVALLLAAGLPDMTARALVAKIDADHPGLLRHMRNGSARHVLLNWRNACEVLDHLECDGLVAEAVVDRLSAIMCGVSLDYVCLSVRLLPNKAEREEKSEQFWRDIWAGVQHEMQTMDPDRSAMAPERAALRECIARGVFHPNSPKALPAPIEPMPFTPCLSESA